MASSWRLNSSDTDKKTSEKVNVSKGSSEKKQLEFAVTAPKYTIGDLIVARSVRDEINTVINAKKCWDTVFNKWGLSTVMKDRQNIAVNLYGEPGTGKTMAAHAIASALGQKMICVNYADIESKYVGETSKNITRLFEYAYERSAVIFFDEADALLSKRVTDMSSATDVSVNQTRSVLLTLMNDYKGAVIFASNFISNYDAAFMRRIQYHIRFELPDAELRQKLWRRYIPEQMPSNVDVVNISEKYGNISGSDISNAVLKAALYAASNSYAFVDHSCFENAIENIIAAKNANKPKIHVETREVSEEYVHRQLNERKNEK
ncbi:MAG: ATP-binding protein [Alistipes sp.]|nr:ATP-binding protein [Alistipes sp.]